MWGLTFKANTDDLRDSPAVAIADRLIAEGADVRAYDPSASDATQDRLPTLQVVADPYEVCREADVLVVMTEWDEFRWLDFDRVAAEMTSPTIVDTRNLLDPAAMRRRGFSYVGVGR